MEQRSPERCCNIESVSHKAVLSGQISPCLLFTLNPWLICPEDCWLRSFSLDWWLWEIWASNPPQPYWYVFPVILLHCPDQRCCTIRFFFFALLLRAILWLSSSLSWIRKVTDTVTSYLSARCRLAGDGRGKCSPFFWNPGVYYRELSPAGPGISRYIEAACCISG